MNHDIRELRYYYDYSQNEISKLYIVFYSIVVPALIGWYRRSYTMFTTNQFVLKPESLANDIILYYRCLIKHPDTLKYQSCS